MQHEFDSLLRKNEKIETSGERLANDRWMTLETAKRFMLTKYECLGLKIGTSWWLSCLFIAVLRRHRYEDTGQHYFWGRLK